MEQTTPAPQQTLLEHVRRRRSELRGAMNHLEAALAVPVRTGVDPWADGVQGGLVELSGAFADHREATEGPEGLFAEVARTSPRLTDAVEHMGREHVLMAEQIHVMLERVRTAATAQDVDDIRDLGTDLLGTLIRHRQRGSDLVYEAYEFDVGGEE